jgi:hypothetical protein
MARPEGLPSLRCSEKARRGRANFARSSPPRPVSFDCMTTRQEPDSQASRRTEEELEEVRRRRLERDWAQPMNERLARLHELCKQMTTVAGAATRR